MLPLAFSDWLAQAAAIGPTQTLVNKRQEVGADYRGYIEAVYKNSGVVYACMAARSLLFTEARFQWRGQLNGRPGDLFGTSELAILEQPWTGGTTGDLLAAAIQDVDLAGNFYAARRPGNKLFRMRPDWVSIVLGTNEKPPFANDGAFEPGDMDTAVIGYVYSP